MDEKERYIANLRTIHTRLAQLLADADAVHTSGQFRGYHDWQDADLAGVVLFNGQPMTRNDLLDMVFRIDEFKSFMRNGAVSQMDRLTIAQKYRSDL